MFHSTLLTIFKIAFVGEARQRESQETLKSRFLAGLVDFSTVEKLVEKCDLTSLTYETLRSELLQIQGRQEITKSLALLRQGQPQETGPAPTALATNTLPTPVAAPPEPMDWAPVAGVSRLHRSNQQPPRAPSWQNYQGARPKPLQWRVDATSGWQPQRHVTSPAYQPPPARTSNGQIRPTFSYNRGDPNGQVNGAYSALNPRTPIRGQQPTDRICYNCRQKGHIARTCPGQPRARPQPVHFIDEQGRLFQQVHPGHIHRGQGITYAPPPVATPHPQHQPGRNPVATIEAVQPPGTSEACLDGFQPAEVLHDPPQPPTEWDEPTISNIVEGSFPGQAPPSKNDGPQ